MKKIFVLLAIANFLTNTAAPLPKPNAQEFGILLGVNGSMLFNMPVFGFNVAGTPNNQSFSYTNISSTQVALSPANNGYYVGLTYNAVKNWDGKFIAQFETDLGRQQITGKLDKKYIKGGGLIRIIFYREKKGDKLYEYKYQIQDLTNAK